MSIDCIFSLKCVKFYFEMPTTVTTMMGIYVLVSNRELMLIE